MPWRIQDTIGLHVDGTSSTKFLDISCKMPLFELVRISLKIKIHTETKKSLLFSLVLFAS